MTLAWTLPDRETVQTADFNLFARSNVIERTLTQDLNGDGVQDLLTLKVSAGGQLDGYAASSGQPVHLASFVFPVDVVFRSGAGSSLRSPRLTRSSPSLATTAT